MTDETKSPPDSATGDATPDEATTPRAQHPPRRTDDKSPSPGFESTDAGQLPPPPTSGQPRPTPESQAALTGKAPSGSSTSGTTVPAASSPTATGNAAPPNETQEEKIARLKRVVEEAKARKAAGQDSVETPPAPKAARPSATAATEATPTTGTTPATPASGTPADASAPEPPGGASPAIGDPTKSPSQADLEKAAKIAEAKARAAAAKQAAGDKPSAPAAPAGAAAAAGAGAPKAPVKKKEEGPKPTDASGHPLVKRLRERLDGAVLEASSFLDQLSVRVAPARIVEVCDALRRDAETPFEYLSDLTCVHFPENFDAPFEVVYHLYSIKANERVRLKVATGETEAVESVTGVWPAANWMEREVYDLFGVVFKNHPDLRRLLLPNDWQGHPLRKDYPLEFIENNWTTKHLPEFSHVEHEQLEQRRAYGLELLSSPYERRVRELFRAGKEVMPKEHK
ncbi:MAG TPA: NADH-quinone oxidoreductase subunit C [Pyrinomonadaceae bacterium]|jgi:NADH-quinone oxidoreductase subunit C|nr:NADH-quinone oxidoreductase subunit C [Pyrinomonadaceae bacterium]